MTVVIIIIIIMMITKNLSPCPVAFDALRFWDGTHLDDYLPGGKWVLSLDLVRQSEALRWRMAFKFATTSSFEESLQRLLSWSNCVSRGFSYWKLHTGHSKLTSPHLTVSKQHRRSMSGTALQLIRWLLAPLWRVPTCFHCWFLMLCSQVQKHQIASLFNCYGQVLWSLPASGLIQGTRYSFHTQLGENRPWKGLSS